MGIIKGLKDTIDWYDNNAASYSRAAKDLFFTEAIEKFSSLLSTSDKVLDAGCGSGRDSALLKNKGFDVTGIDISKGLLNEAKKEHPGINFIEGDLLKLPFSENSFDGVWAHASLVHLETVQDAQKAINEFHRVLISDGVVHILSKSKVVIKRLVLLAINYLITTDFFNTTQRMRYLEC